MVKIIADSTCDLSPELIERYQIRILPLFVRLDEKEYLDGVDITPDELFDWSDENKKTPSTAAPSPENVLEAAAQGLGTCWVNYFPHEEVKKAFGLPEEERPVLLMPIGYAAEESVPSPNHTKKRPLEELVKEL